LWKKSSLIFQFLKLFEVKFLLSEIEVWDFFFFLETGIKRVPKKTINGSFEHKKGQDWFNKVKEDSLPTC